MIFCVEDDESIQSLELYALRSAGFEVRGFVDGDSFLEALRTEIPQLVILDVMLPGKSGVELLKLMKESSATREIAVIMATAKGAEYDKIQSLDLGGNDYWRWYHGSKRYCAGVTPGRIQRSWLQTIW